MWYAKMYFSEGREIFQYDSLGTQGVPDVQKEFPFLESLLSFQELDCAEVTPMLQSATDNWSRFIAEDDRDALENVRRKLWRLASIHIYFRLLYVHCRYRQSAMYNQNDRGSAEDCRYGMVIKIIFTFPLCHASLYPVCHMPSFHDISFWLPVPLRIHHIHSSYNGYSSS